MGLKLRQLAKPLDEARKDPRVDKAVLFVEDLFGAKMKSSPSILIIDDSNRKKYLNAVKEDSTKFNRYDAEQMGEGQKIGFVSSLLSIVYSKEKLQQMKKEYDPNGEWIIISPRDILVAIKNPAALIDKIHVYTESVETLTKLASDEDYKGTTRRLISKPIGLCMENENLIIINEREGLPSITLVHELIHKEDKEYLDCGNPLYRTIIEGRATFAEALLMAYETGTDPNKINTKMLDYARGLALFGEGGHIDRYLNILKNSPRLLKRAGVIETLKTMRNDAKEFLRRLHETTFTMQKYYAPFTITIAEMAYLLNDPYAAFRMTTEKQPRTMEELKNFREFYKKEIEEYKRTS